MGKIDTVSTKFEGYKAICPVCGCGKVIIGLYREQVEMNMQMHMLKHRPKSTSRRQSFKKALRESTRKNTEILKELSKI